MGYSVGSGLGGMLASASLSEEAGDGLLIEERALGVLLVFSVLHGLGVAQDVQGLFGSVAYAKLLAGLPFLPLPRGQLGAGRLVAALRVVPERRLPLQSNRIDLADRGGVGQGAHPALHRPDLFFLRLAVARGLS